MHTIYQHIKGLIQKGIERKLIEKADCIYVRNLILAQLQLKTYPESLPVPTEDTIPNLLDKIVAYAVEQEVIWDTFDDKEILAANIMNIFVARPSVINQTFYDNYKESPATATDYFYNLSQNSNYIQTNRIKKNVHFKADTQYGQLDITINLSKPEKDPEQIKRERETKTVHYPKCLLCVENEGYEGRTGHPARANHRIIHVPLMGENWYLQYSPYVYYNEHSIVLSEEHRDMKIDKEAFARLLTFVEKFPHYFIGSNADLPIVGGSILSHDHYQAGNYEFAMTRAKDAFTFLLENFPDVSASVLQWPMSVIRLRSPHKEAIISAADHILQQWKNHSDSAADVYAFTGQTPHNTVTSIARMDDGSYELDLVLRNNRISEEHPMGIFHPHADVHHIKKENIGLIEVMGLAVLPARLKEELIAIQHYLLGQTNHVPSIHQSWADQLFNKYGKLSDTDQAKEILQKELGEKFARVLEDAGVFKNKEAFERFLVTLNK